MDLLWVDLVANPRFHYLPIYSSRFGRYFCSSELNESNTPYDSKMLNESPLMNAASTLHQLTRGTPHERAQAAEYLAQQGPDAAYAASELTAACGDNAEISHWAVAALEELGPPPASAIDALATLAQSQEPLTAYWAVTLLGRAGRDALEHQGVIADLLEQSPDLALREKAAWSLGRMRANSLEATQALQQAAQSPKNRLSRIATKSLQQTQT